MAYDYALLSINYSLSKGLHHRSIRVMRWGVPLFGVLLAIWEGRAAFNEDGLR